MTIKNIIFDLGVVVLDIDYNGPAKLLEHLGVFNFSELYSKAKQDSLFDNLEKGLITPDDFRMNFKKIIGINLSNTEIDNIWNAMILDFPPQRMELLKTLKKIYRTYLLSNTNKIHYDFYTKLLNEGNGLQWDDLFHATYFSHEMGLKKPHAEIYIKAMHVSKVKAEETLFIDDLYENVEAAKACGLHTIWLKEGMELSVVFEKDKLSGVLKPKFELFY